MDHEKSNQLGHFSPFSTYLRSIFKSRMLRQKNYLEEFGNPVFEKTLLKLSKKLFFLETKKFMVETKTTKQQV